MWLSGSHLCRCGAQEETSVHILCGCEALVIPRHTYLGSLFSDPGDVRSLSLGAIWSFSKGTGLPYLGHQFKGGQGACQKGLHALGLKVLKPIYYSILFYTVYIAMKMA